MGLDKHEATPMSDIILTLVELSMQTKVQYLGYICELD